MLGVPSLGSRWEGSRVPLFQSLPGLLARVLGPQKPREVVEVGVSLGTLTCGSGRETHPPGACAEEGAEPRSAEAQSSL